VLGRPMPPARALVEAGAAVALATDFNPGQRLLREPAHRQLARLHAARPLAGEALGAVTVNAAHVLGRADRIGRLAPGTTPTSSARRARLAPPRVPRRRRGRERRRTVGRPRVAALG
jgi:cytosine/adenosine deaminase-related metal-dependent hydrolase